MILSFADRDTEALANGSRLPNLAHVEHIARRKLLQLQIATRLEDLRVAPGNRLRALPAEQSGLYGIQVFETLHLRFYWTRAGAEQVQLAYLDVLPP